MEKNCFRSFLSDFFQVNFGLKYYLFRCEQSINVLNQVFLFLLLIPKIGWLIVACLNHSFYDWNCIKYFDILLKTRL